MTSEAADRRFMRLALRLGRRGLGRTSPNPPVGAVVVRDGRVVGKGYHRVAGAPHAEVEALRQAGPRARGATLYVTLEPCNHHGRTPPCTEAVLAAGIRRVVLGVLDPNPHVSGGGARRLAEAGVEVVAGVEADACAELIEGFAKRSTTGLPFVTLKLAASADGRIATADGESRWITSEQSRRLVHRLRDYNDAVVVGAGTVATDDPRLTCRLRGGRDPLRVIIDGALRVPPNAQVVQPEMASGTVVFTARRNARRARELRRRGVRVVELPAQGGRLSLARVLEMLAAEGISSVLCEGGATLAAGLLREGLVDRALFFYAPKLLGGDGVPMIGALGVRRMVEALPLGRLRLRRVGPDWMVRAELREIEHEPGSCS